MPTPSPAPPADGKPSNPPPRFAVTLPGAPATGERVADGTLVYADSHGTFRVGIIGATARLLPEPGGQGRHTCLHATPLP
ncbi:DUF6296 family protein [Kitasatospora sp. NPDC091207]|uniref:DUF6296 family protein n=1 Tax=Kitasatospora sp. NPDC091207 TaxID=3364083 RepID=UPI003827604E